jgi:hypothetical protein
MKETICETGVDGRIILKWILEKWDEGYGWISVAQVGDRWRVFVKVVMNLRVP